MIDARTRFQGTYTKLRAQTRFVVIHHAGFDYRPRYGLRAVQAIADYHIGRWGTGIAYHVVAAQFSPDAADVQLVQCSDPDTLRYGVAWQNERSVHISAATNYDLHPGGIPGAAWIEAAARAVVWALALYPSATVVGHREIALGPDSSPDHQDWRTACPGARWPIWKTTLLNRVAELRGTAAPAPTPAPGTPDLAFLTTIVDTNCRTGPGRAPGNVIQRFAQGRRWGYHPEPVRGEIIGGNDRWWHSGDNRFFVHDSCLK